MPGPPRGAAPTRPLPQGGLRSAQPQDRQAPCPAGQHHWSAEWGVPHGALSLGGLRGFSSEHRSHQTRQERFSPAENTASSRPCRRPPLHRPPGPAGGCPWRALSLGITRAGKLPAQSADLPTWLCLRAMPSDVSGGRISPGLVGGGQTEGRSLFLPRASLSSAGRAGRALAPRSSEGSGLSAGARQKAGQWFGGLPGGGVPVDWGQSGEVSFPDGRQGQRGECVRLAPRAGWGLQRIQLAPQGPEPLSL